ncbi:hypothetical protein [Streptomyces sp. NPDC056672]|uniref:hypothetical protein n=1 Tax=Streptomyces sp. NPDC056672 TaxID=3345906 RepID=UPI0036C8E0F7
MGKVTNCQAGVSLRLASGTASGTVSAAVDWRLSSPGAGIPPRRRPIRPRWPAANGAASRRTWATSRSGNWPWT